MSTALGGRAGGPGAFDHGFAGVGSPGLGDRTLPAWLTGGIVRGEQTEALHACSWRSDPGESAHGGHPGDRDRALDAAPGLPGFAHRVQTPGVDVVVECLLKPLASLGVCVHGTDLCWKDAVLRRGGTEHCRAPAQVGRAPMGPAHVPAILSEPEGLKTARGVLEVADASFTCPGESTDGCIFPLGDRDGGESRRACSSGQWHGSTALRFDPLPWLCGDQRRRDHPAVMIFCAARAVAPRAAGAGFRDEEEMCGLRWHFSDALIDGTLAGANAAEGDDLSAVIVGHVGHSTRICVDVHADEECARLRQG